MTNEQRDKTLTDAQGAVDMLATLLALGHVSEAILPYKEQQEWKEHLRGVSRNLNVLQNEVGRD